MEEMGQGQYGEIIVSGSLVLTCSRAGLTAALASLSALRATNSSLRWSLFS